MLEKVDEGLKLSKNAAHIDAEVAESSNAILTVDDKVRQKDEDLPKGAKLWEGIFSEDGPRRIIFDEVDGIPRCGSCASEVHDGQCSNPACAIEYDSDSDYGDLRRRGYDDDDEVDDLHSGDSDDDRPYRDGGGGDIRHNDALARRLRDFEAQHGRSEGLHRGTRLDLPDDFTGITYIDSSGNEQIARMDDDSEDDEEMDDFIVRDGEDGDPRNYFDDSDSESDGVDDLLDGEEGYFDDEEDDFLPGPRRVVSTDLRLRFPTMMTKRQRTRKRSKVEVIRVWSTAGLEEWEGGGGAVLEWLMMTKKTRMKMSITIATRRRVRTAVQDPKRTTEMQIASWAAAALIACVVDALVLLMTRKRMRTEKKKSSLSPHQHVFKHIHIQKQTVAIAYVSQNLFHRTL